MEGERKALADKLLFSKEAAEYLGISVQRLAVLTKEGRIIPLKKNSSGTIYHIDELEKRKKELSIFSSAYAGYESKGEEAGMFEINTETKNEALNLAVAMNILHASEKKACKIIDLLDRHIAYEPMTENIHHWEKILDTSHETIKKEYENARLAFNHLHETDEIIRIGDPSYPKLLSQTEEAPRFLYLRGRINLLQDIRTVALVGSRQAGEEGRKNTERVARILGSNGIIIVSGLAKGIDVTAHKAALDNGLPTIAVIGTNLNQYYPSENKDVQKRIEQEGLVVSQFSPATKTERWFFPLRDGVMSGLSQATVIMEAGETSGALKQARYALKQNRLVLIPQNAFNIPSITWPEKFEKLGALRVKTPSEIIEILSEHRVYRTEESHTIRTYDLFDADNMIVADISGEYRV